MKYQESLDAVRTAVGTSGIGSTNFEGRVIVPAEARVPEGKFVAKIDLAQMTTAGSKPAYPDPMLLAYKSSVNWTRMFGFQLIAESEPEQSILGSSVSVDSELTGES